MVSLTFDEFHAIRSRQRAATEAAAARPNSKPNSEPGQSVAGSSSSSLTSARGAKDGAGEKLVPPSGSTTLHVGTPRGRRPPPLATATTTGAARTGADGHLPLEKANKAGGWSGLGASNLGHFVELFEVQVAVVVLIYLDLVASTAQLLPYFQQPEEFERRGEREGGAELAGAWIGRLITRFMQSFTGFTLIFFAIEVVMLLAAFRRKFFRHLGYVLDLCVVSVCLYHELVGAGKGVRLLGVLRVWRVARVMNTLLLSADEAHDETKNTLLHAEERTQDLDTDRRRLQETLRREVEARKRVENMLRGYKDEVETLNEALKIAALDIASAGVSSDSGGEVDDRGGAMVDRLSVSPIDSDKIRSRSTQGGVESNIGAGVIAGEGKAARPSPSSDPTGQIFVFHDGTFEAR